MKSRKGFTLIELLAVIVILGVLMIIAIPNVVSTLDKNKKETFIEDAKTIVRTAEYKIRADSKIEWPDDRSITILKLSSIDNEVAENSPFDTVYSKELSFVAITKELSGTDYKYVYYVHLMSCIDPLCESTGPDALTYTRGINLTGVEGLDSGDRFDLVLKGVEVDTQLINNLESIRSQLGRDNINIY